MDRKELIDSIQSMLCTAIAGKNNSVIDWSIGYYDGKAEALRKVLYLLSKESE